ncbi:MAG: group II intron maturase-specific domain-containing protein, partial [Nitrospinota bacterium]
SKVNFIRYADDFIVTAAEKTLLEDNVIPAINEFLKQRSLKLSSEKTKIVRIEEGFDFLGQNMRKFRGKLITTPAKENKKKFLDKVRSIIRKSQGIGAHDLIQRLNPVILGWANYHRHVQAAKAFSEANAVLFHALMRWARREHPNKSKGWIVRKYFSESVKNWAFSCVNKNREESKTLFTLTMPSSVKLVRYIKVQGEANPFDHWYLNYFKMRNSKSNCFAI